MVAMCIYILIALSYIPPVTAVFNGAGEIYFTHKYQYTKKGIRIIYRPENYQTYSAVGKGWRAYIGFYGTLSEFYTRQSYQSKVLSERSSWSAMKWEVEGKYYYYEQIKGGVSPEFWLGYGVDIYNADSELIYQDLNHFHQVPSTVEYCELDEDAYSFDTKCSEALESTKQKTNNFRTETQDTEPSTPAGAIAAAVVVPVLVIILVVGIVVCVRRGGCDRFKQTPAVRSTTNQPNGNNQPVATVSQGILSPPPPYQPATVQPQVSYTPAAPQTVQIIQPQVQAPVQTVQIPPTVIQPTVVQPTVIAAPAPRVVAAPPTSRNPLSGITPSHIRTAGAVLDLMGSASDLMGGLGGLG